MLGQVVYESETYHISGVQLLTVQSKEINASRLAAGLYKLGTQIGSEIFVRNVIITH